MALTSLPNLPYFLVGYLKGFFLVLVSLIAPSNAPRSSESESDELRFDRRPSVPVPLHFIVASIKENLIVSTYDHHVLTCVSESCGGDCAVCLAVMEGWDEVIGLPNCRHVFHKDCIDAWIDKCKTTCPVCRSGLVLGRGEKLLCGGDPWRRERKLYLFGEDSFL